MRAVTKISLCLMPVIMLAGMGDLSAYEMKKQKAYSIGVRASYFPMPYRSTQVHASHPDCRVSFETEGFGGNFYFTSRISRNWLLEVTAGGIVSVRGVSEGDCWDDCCCGCEDHECSDIDVESITPLLVGLRYQLTSLGRHSNLQPYVSAGAGPYWISRVQTVTEPFEEEVTTSAQAKRGAYAGAGFDCAVAGWLGFNVDVKYHFVDLDASDRYSDFEFGVGVQIMWGSY
ncbi:outer membrane beta-barrel protein [candidate division KSB1 bacterium]|nr:outer membrane beta-barrel protein [candidate division KSB1 bacterium]